jgi:two-component system sensor histidine kinase ResE
MIERVLTNLIENALAHTPREGRVEVSVIESGETLRISVADTGSGIAPEDLPHIFERFYRADKSRDRGSPGSGLGLAIAKEIVELHGGTIEAESPPRNGAVIRFALPVRATDR